VLKSKHQFSVLCGLYSVNLHEHRSVSEACGPKGIAIPKEKPAPATQLTADNDGFREQRKKKRNNSSEEKLQFKTSKLPAKNSSKIVAQSKGSPPKLFSLTKNSGYGD
jgi:hypothetical protein